jgi:hypothetical protein
VAMASSLFGSASSATTSLANIMASAGVNLLPYASPLLLIPSLSRAAAAAAAATPPAAAGGSRQAKTSATAQIQSTSAAAKPFAPLPSHTASYSSDDDRDSEDRQSLPQAHRTGDGSAGAAAVTVVIPPSTAAANTGNGGNTGRGGVPMYRASSFGTGGSRATAGTQQLSTATAPVQHQRSVPNLGTGRHTLGGAVHSTPTSAAHGGGGGGPLLTPTSTASASGMSPMKRRTLSEASESYSPAARDSGPYSAAAQERASLRAAIAAQRALAALLELAMSTTESLAGAGSMATASVGGIAVAGNRRVKTPFLVTPSATPLGAGGTATAPATPSSASAPIPVPAPTPVAASAAAGPVGGAVRPPGPTSATSGASVDNHFH